MSEIETLEDWNAVLGGCSGCCELPECPVPELVCESVTRVRACGDNDFTVAVRLWEGRRDFWVAEDPENREPGDFPEEAPEEPEDYLDFSYGCFLPFVEPGAGPDEDVPTLYGRREDRFSILTTEGTAKWYLSGDAGFPSTEALFVWTGGVDEGSYTVSGTQARKGTEPGDVDYFCNSYTDSGEGTPPTWSFAWVPGALPDPAFTCEAALRREVLEVEEYFLAGSVSALVGCPLSDPEGFGEKNEKEADAQRIIADEIELSEPITRSELLAAVVGDLPGGWPTDESVGEECGAFVGVDWPKMSEIESWPECDGDLPQTTEAGAEARIFRYRWRIPVGHEGTFFRIDWDEVFYPLGWDAMIEDPENPEEEIRDPEAPLPVLTPKSVEWTGPGDPEDAEDATWFTEWSAVVRVPEGEEGTVEVRNVRYSCYRSRAGSKPQVAESFGIEELPEEEPEP